MMKQALALLLSAVLLLPACGGGTNATTIHLKHTEGTVGVSDGAGKDLEPRKDLGLYSGYGVDTETESYAWIDLDDVKLTKLDEDSEIEIQKEGKALEIEVLSGSLFFNVIEPLAEDETMTIRSSSMLVGIRGTCGWVTLSEDEESLSLYLLEGKVEVSTGENTAAVTAWEMAKMSADGEIEVSAFSDGAVPAFVREELEEDVPASGPEEGTTKPIVTLTMPVTAEEISDCLRLDSVQEVIVQSGGEDEVLSIREPECLIVPEGKSLTLEEGIHLSPQESGAHVGLSVGGQLHIKSDFTNYGNVSIYGGVLRVDGDFTNCSLIANTAKEGSGGQIIAANGIRFTTSGAALYNHGQVDSPIIVEDGDLTVTENGAAGEIVLNAGQLLVSNGGTVGDVVMNNGHMVVHEGGTTGSVELNDGWLLIRGGKTGAIAHNGGLLDDQR